MNESSDKNTGDKNTGTSIKNAPAENCLLLR